MSGETCLLATMALTLTLLWLTSSLKRSIQHPFIPKTLHLAILVLAMCKILIAKDKDKCLRSCECWCCYWSWIIWGHTHQRLCMIIREGMTFNWSDIPWMLMCQKHKKIKIKIVHKSQILSLSRVSSQGSSHCVRNLVQEANSSSHLGYLWVPFNR